MLYTETHSVFVHRLCEKCDGKCVVCDSYVRPATLVRVCDECNYGSYSGRCVICGGVGISDAYYCKVALSASLCELKNTLQLCVKRFGAGMAFAARWHD